MLYDRKKVMGHHSYDKYKYILPHIKRLSSGHKNLNILFIRLHPTAKYFHHCPLNTSCMHVFYDNPKWLEDVSLGKLDRYIHQKQIVSGRGTDIWSNDMNEGMSGWIFKMKEMKGHGIVEISLGVDDLQQNAKFLNTF